MRVKFNNSLTQSQYDALGTKDAGTLYFTTDTKKIYKGDALHAVSGAVTNVEYSTGTKLFTITMASGTTQQISFVAELSAKQDAKPNGTDSLVGGNNKIASVYLPDSLLGQLEYCGTFNANTGAMVSDLREPSGRAWRKGDYAIATIAGTKFPDATAAGRTIDIGDWAVHNGTSWDVVDNTDAVSSVAGKTGVVTLVKGDVGLGNVDNTADASKNVLSATKLTTARTINGVAFDGTANITISSTDSTKEPVLTGAVAKTTPIDADSAYIRDSADSNKTKATTFANIKAFLKSYFDNLYNKVIVNNTLTSTSTAEALSAAKGKELADALEWE